MPHTDLPAAVTLLEPSYFAPVDWYAALVAADAWRFRSDALFTGQRCANRTVILMPDGPQTLTIPLVASTTHGLLRDVRISDHGRWRSHHWNALRTAYGKSPFFEYYADDFAIFYDSRRWEFLADFCIDIHATVSRLIDLPDSLAAPEPDRPSDSPSDDTSPASNPAVFSLDAALDAAAPQPPYYQVFAQRLGFQPHLGIADLLFNLGPESILYLRRLAAHKA